MDLIRAEAHALLAVGCLPRLDIRPRIKPDFEVAIAIQQGELGTMGSAV
jgi:hypothetical protein